MSIWERVHVGVGVQWIGATGPGGEIDLFAIGKPIVVRVRIGRIGPIRGFIRDGHAIAVRVRVRHREVVHPAIEGVLPADPQHNTAGGQGVGIDILESQRVVHEDASPSVEGLDLDVCERSAVEAVILRPRKGRHAVDRRVACDLGE